MSSNTPENKYGQPGQNPAPYPQAPAPSGQQPGQYGAPAVDPGKTMAIIAIILPFVGFGLVGLILGIVAKVKSKKAGYKNTLALVAIIISAVAIVASIIVTIVLINFSLDLAQQLVELCQDGSETVTVNGQPVSCSSVSGS
ncbi:MULTISPECIES: DUF4190 domain-containing protein [unclassified Arthrobacter]|uniref:DUF4190 domain-containing protein n=1 Tax=unclassified Arthrobacter TaxID=235627 RepID=UPI000CE4E92B|nr:MULTISPECIES: DUF4190 domain-containing protein [unclassified Arthrobacter]